MQGSSLPSHSSDGAFTLSPQTTGTGLVQLERQVSVSLVLPSSHCSPVSLVPSPHSGSMQLVRQASAVVSEFRVVPSSHSSAGGSTTPLPQIVPTVQLFLQASVSTVLPSSHPSPLSL